MVNFLGFDGYWELEKGPCIVPFSCCSIVNMGWCFLLTTGEGQKHTLHRDEKGLLSEGLGIWKIFYDFDTQLLIVDILGLEYGYRRVAEENNLLSLVV